MEFCKILEQLLSIFFRGGEMAASEKKTDKKKDAQLPMWFQVFTFSRAVIH